MAERLHLRESGLHLLTAGPLLPAFPGNAGEVVNGSAASRVALADLDVGICDGLEHLRQVRYTEPVQTQVADPRLQVDPDAPLVTADRALAPLLAPEPDVQPLPHREAAVEVLAGPEASANLFGIRERCLLVRYLLQQTSDLLDAFGVVGVRYSEQGSYPVEVGLRFLESGIARAVEGATGAVGTLRQLLTDGVGAVLTGGELRAGLAERLAGFSVAAVAAAVGGALHWSFSSGSRGVADSVSMKASSGGSGGGRSASSRRALRMRPR